jgi:hypothetical protein
MRIEVSLEELGFIAEALEQFLDATPEDMTERPAIEKLFKRIENKNAKANGEPEEGY